MQRGGAPRAAPAGRGRGASRQVLRCPAPAGSAGCRAAGRHTGQCAGTAGRPGKTSGALLRDTPQHPRHRALAAPPSSGGAGLPQVPAHHNARADVCHRLSSRHGTGGTDPLQPLTACVLHNSPARPTCLGVAGEQAPLKLHTGDGMDGVRGPHLRQHRQGETGPGRWARQQLPRNAPRPGLQPCVHASPSEVSRRAAPRRLGASTTALIARIYNARCIITSALTCAADTSLSPRCRTLPSSTSFCSKRAASACWVAPSHREAWALQCGQCNHLAPQPVLILCALCKRRRRAAALRGRLHCEARRHSNCNTRLSCCC